MFQNSFMKSLTLLKILIDKIIINQIKMLALQRALSIRTESSHEYSQSANTDRSACFSVQSVKYDADEVSQTIKQLILEEKRKNFVCKTQVNYKPQNLKRFHSLSMITSKKQAMTLPIHLQRILHSNRKCPNLGTDDLLDSIYGAFFGFLIGDIAGAHLAYKIDSLQYYIPEALLMNGGGTYNLGPGQGTQQTQLLFSTCYGLIDSRGSYNKGHMANQYLKWIQTKPFNVSPIFLLATNQIKKLKLSRASVSVDQLGEMLSVASTRNRNHQSNLGLARILPLVVWSLDLADNQFYQLLKDQLSMICPNQLVVQTAILYGMMLRIIFKTNDHQLAFYEAAKWVYSKGSQKLQQLWNFIQFQILIQTHGNMGRLKTSFTYACIQINKKEVKFVDSLVKTLLKGGDSDANCSIVMALIGSIVGYNQIPSYFKQKIVNSRMTQSSRPRNQQYTPYKVIQIVDKLMRFKPSRSVKEELATFINF